MLSTENKTTKNKVQGAQANSFISVSFKTLVCPHRKAWKVQEASKRDDQTHTPFQAFKGTGQWEPSWP